MNEVVCVRVLKAKKTVYAFSVSLPPLSSPARHPTRRRHMSMVGGRFNYVRLGCDLRTKGYDDNSAYKTERKKSIRLPGKTSDRVRERHENVCRTSRKRWAGVRLQFGPVTAP